MKIKILFPNEKGKIELTKIELEALLEECYQDGIAEGKKLSSFYCQGPNDYTTFNYATEGTKLNPIYCQGLDDYTTTCRATTANTTDSVTYTITSEKIEGKINE